jgi:hypothetical protein
MDALNLTLFIHTIESGLAECMNQITLVVFDFCQPDALQQALESLRVLKSAPRLSAITFPTWPITYTIGSTRRNHPFTDLARLCSRTLASRLTQTSRVPFDLFITAVKREQFPEFEPTNRLPSPLYYFTDFLLASLELDTNSVTWWDNRTLRLFPVLKRLTLTAGAVFVHEFLMTNTLPSLTSAKIRFDGGYQSTNSENVFLGLQGNPRFERVEELSISFPVDKVMLSVFALFAESPVRYLDIPSGANQLATGSADMKEILKALSQFRSSPSHIELSSPGYRFTSNFHLILKHLNLHHTKRLKIASTPITSDSFSWKFGILNRAPALKELVLYGVRHDHILPYLSLEADQLERLEISNQRTNTQMGLIGAHCIPIFPSLRHIQCDHSAGDELIPCLLGSAPNLCTLLVNLNTRHEITFFVGDLKSWLAPRRDGTISTPYLKILHVNVVGPRYSRGTRLSAIESVNTLLSACNKAGVGRTLNIAILWKDPPGVQLRWENGQPVFTEEVGHIQATGSYEHFPFTVPHDDTTDQRSLSEMESQGTSLACCSHQAVGGLII